MRNLADNVNARYVEKARERTNGASGRLQPSLHISEAIPTQHDNLWERIKRFTPSPEVLDVAGRQVSGFVVPHWAAGVLLAAILGSMGFMYSRLGDQRDMLIRLDTQLQERDRHESEYRGEFKTKLNVQQLQIDNMTSELKVVKAILTPQQLRTVENQTRKADN